MKNKRWILLGVAAAALMFFCMTGCTELERSGYSAIPQNHPGSWELSPYGDFGN